MTSDPDKVTTPAVNRRGITEPDFSGKPRPVGELTVQDGFPQCALGAYIDIRGFAGVVVEIVKESIKVRSPEGITQRFNANRLKTLYAPPVHDEPVGMMPTMNGGTPDAAPEPVDSPTAAPLRVQTIDPDFTAPVHSINDYASQPDFPACAFGRHVDVLGYSGVVVGIVKGSLKIRSPAGTTRSYNAEILRKLHGKP